MTREARAEFGDERYGGVHMYRESYCEPATFELFIKMPSEGQPMPPQEWAGFPVQPTTYSWDEMREYQQRFDAVAESQLAPLGVVGGAIDLRFSAVRVYVVGLTAELEATIRAVLGAGPWLFDSEVSPIEGRHAYDSSGGCAQP